MDADSRGLALGGLLGAMFADSPILSTLVSAMLIGLLVFAALALLRMLRAPRVQPRPLQYAGLGSETVAAPPPSQAAGFDLQAGVRAQRPAGPERVKTKKFFFWIVEARWCHRRD